MSRAKGQTRRTYKAAFFLHGILGVVGFSGFFGAGSALAQDAVPNEYIVKFRDVGSEGTAVSSGQKFLGKLGAKVNLKSSIPDLKMHAVSLKTSDALEELKNDPDVEYVEPNYLFHRFQEVPGAGELVSLQDIESARGDVSALGTFSQNAAAVQVNEAWAAMSATGSRIVVAVIDTGVDVTHPVFTGLNAIWTNPNEVPGNGTDDDGNGYVDDYYGWNFYARNGTVLDDEGHGTHVAGTVLGVTTDIFATPTTPSPIQVMPLKFLSSSGTGSTSDAVSAIYYAVTHGARVINASWGGTTYSQALHDAIAYAYSRGVVFVAAAGNYSSNNDQTPIYPSNLPVPSLASIAASTPTDALASFSNFGRSSVLVSSPGVSILSTYPGNQYRSMSGTSMASPFVAGLAALVLRESPQLSAYQVKSVLASATTAVGNLSGVLVTGARTNALSVVQMGISLKSTAYYQPAYIASAPAGARDPASVASSSGSSSGSKGGCGSIMTVAEKFRGPPPPGSASPIFWVLLCMPLCVWVYLRMRSVAKPQRQHDRFMMTSEVRMQVGGKEIVGQMKTISVGGLSFSADALLEKGGVLKLQISSPDGKQQIEAEGRIVWSQEQKAYGVQFGENSLSETIRSWCQALPAASKPN